MKDLLAGGASFDGARKYRYRLWRMWNEERPWVAFCLLNPSTADEVAEDPTVRRCIGFAKAWGYGGLSVVNIFAWRGTDPSVLKTVVDPVGPDNDAAILEAAGHAQKVIAAWGVHGALQDRGSRVRGLLGAKAYHLGLTRGGYPKHPLYLPGSTKPVEWRD